MSHKRTETGAGAVAARMEMPGLLRGPADTAGFARDAEAFLTSRFEREGEVFAARILQWPVVFAASHEAVGEALHPERELSSAQGYKSFAGLGLFGPAVLFQDGEQHALTKAQLRESQFAHPERLEASGTAAKLHQEVRKQVLDLRSRCDAAGSKGLEIGVYEWAKTLCADLLHLVFLAQHIKTDADDAANFQALHRTLWRGTVSSGINFNVDLGVFGLKKKSAFREAKDARAELARLFADADDAHADTNPPTCPFRREISAKQDRVDHYIMFTSSMVGKAVGSVVSSFVMLLAENPLLREELASSLQGSETRQNDTEAAGDENDLLARCLLEVERLYPPVIGCCRTTTAATVIGKRQLAAGTKVWCSFLTANRDPKVYKNPTHFDPERWKASSSDPAHLSFGAGAHQCLGRPLARQILRAICGELVRSFTAWEVCGSREYRWLPVARPVSGVISNRDPRDNEDPSLQSPVFYGLEFEEVFIQTPTPGVELHAWIIFAPAQGPPKSLPTVLFLHGNAGNIGHRLPFAEDVVLYGNCNIMLVDYRGFGRSTGAPSEEGLIEDGMSALSYLRECPDVDPENIFLMGRSLGGAVSIALASKLATRAGLDLGFRGLILENTFLSVPTLVRDHIRDTLSLDRGLMQELCTGAVNTVVWLDWNSASRIKALPEELDVLLISGVLDEIVPSSHMTKLYALAGPNVVKTLLRIPGGDHNFSWARPGYFRGLKAFLHEKGKSSVPSSDTLGSQPLSVEK
ncbi:Protein ABHD13 [Hondaea fermentalgiana]|uniref:Protein ABHD13 n=1 Tax=Hondaea fermentalgiana TaxID=2315210 RepID=A0A2R5GN36_9STRA|nr:Protein ABHD13 [Hondaea fermentalgiana]|eukprot:GBG30033.1 Protein ABHD13 [Hondaea fermentalgiana]